MKTFYRGGTALLLTAALALGSPGAALASASAPHFDPFSVTFVSLHTGWALGTGPCHSSAGACLSLEQTRDAGASWVPKPLPGALVAGVDKKLNSHVGEFLGPGMSPLNVRFADLLDGWVYGEVPASNGSEPFLWSTHDGGASWHQLHPFASADVLFPLFDLEALGGTVYLMGVNSQYGVTVESSPVSSDSWHRDEAPKMSLPVGGAEPSGSFIFEAGRGCLSRATTAASPGAQSS